MRTMCGFGPLLFVWLLSGAVVSAQDSIEVDTDHYGLTDVQEQALLERFVPRFQVSRTDCAVKPALFEEGVVKPTVIERDGTIYGQGTQRKTIRGGHAVVEVHFYDLWSVDCGRLGASAGRRACVGAAARCGDG
jgi:hypothetical protein